MTRYDDDIPEIFRRAMEEAGWKGEEEQRREEPPGQPPTLPPWWTNRWLWLIVIGLILLASFSWIVTTYTEWLWFGELGYQSAWLTLFTANVVTFLIFFTVAALFLLSNWLLARRMAIATGPMGPALLRLSASRWLIVGAALFLAYLMGTAAAANNLIFLRFLYQQPFDISDPVFDRNLSFYMFDLPVYTYLHGWILPLIFLTLVGVVAIYVLNNLPRFRGGRFQIQTLPLALRQHVALLLTLMLGAWAAGYWLDIYGLLFSPRGVVFGAGYTDLHATLLGLRVQLVLMLVLALAVAYNIFRPDFRPALVAGGLWLAATVGLGIIYPGIQQRYVVEPNELALERPYISHNIAFTRAGFDLTDVEGQDFSPITELSGADLAQNSEVLRNIRLWDYRPLQQTYSQLQELRPYYEFSEIDIDRYIIDGEYQQVMLAGRELEGLADPTWVNERLEFTHGYGVVMNPVDQVTREGRPVLYIKDLPPQSTIDLEVTRPEIYYGELTDEVVYVGSGLEEFNYPRGDQNVYSSYEGTGGVPLENILTRLAFTYRFADANLLFSQYVTPETRVMFHREISDRVRRIAPFLIMDHDPYLVITEEGRLVWMQDAYTVSGNFPYSQPTRTGTATIPAGINYIRNSVKATVDAYNGDVRFYIADPDDPIIQTYAGIFPELFRPLDAMPENLRNHIRYPEGIFLMQSQQFLVYHMLDEQVFYNREDLWAIPNEVFDSDQQPMEPYYVIFPLPGEEEAEFLLIQPYTPAGRNNMIAWLAARSDPPNYGEIVAFELPKQELVFGPIQVEGRIDQDPEISQQFSLWNQLGSSVIRGNLIVVPINNSFLYVEPIYLLSETSALPELQRVIVASGERIAMRETLDEALLALLSDEAIEVVQEEIQEVTGLNLATGTVEELISRANDHFEAAQAAQQAGDWAAYGEELGALEDTLARLMELTGAAELPAEEVPAGDVEEVQP